MDSKTGTKDYLGVRKSLDGHSLGELEAQILDIIWDLDPPVTTAQVFKIMYPRRELSYSTIMLTMAKLSKKGILTQQRTGDKKTDPFIYTPNISRQEMGMRLLEEVSQKVLKNPLHVVVGEILSESLSQGDIKKVTSALEAAAKK